MKTYPGLRPTLCVMAGAVLIADIVWMSSSKAEVLEFLTEPTLTRVGIDEQGFAKLPVYHPADDSWHVVGRRVPSIRPFIWDDDPQQIGPDSIRYHAVIRLGAPASGETAQRAYLKLASDGICQVAIAPEQAPRRGDPFREADVRIVTKVRDGDREVACVDRINPR